MFQGPENLTSHHPTLSKRRANKCTNADVRLGGLKNEPLTLEAIITPLGAHESGSQMHDRGRGRGRALVAQPTMPALIHPRA